MIPVIDIFAGPGGLGEGFSALGSGGVPAFKIKLSLEKDFNAHSTLRLRAFYRQFQKADVPDDYYKVLRRELDVAELYTRFPSEARAANDEAVQFTLGEETWTEAEGLIEKALNGATKWLLIGGPPCQAYSVIGRSRNKGKEEYKAKDDARHFLYREYLRILGRFRPSVFVMENVKGLLSSKPEGSLIFDTILNDLKAPVEALADSPTPLSGPAVGYRLFSLVEDDAKGKRSYVVKAELHGIPQARHRVIIIGIRDDLGAFVPDRLPVTDPVPVKDVISGLPRLRSGISRSEDSSETWLELIKASVYRRWFQTAKGMGPNIEQQLCSAISQMTKPQNDRGGEFIPHVPSVSYKPQWFLDERIQGVCNHASRAHIEKDLYRYFYAACYAKAQKTSPVLRDFPKDLIPNHVNAVTAIEKGNLFEDRFRVQLSTKPATTVTSHIAKDGHYYIHPDPTQCRSLTVREAARLQTFPDNYLFTGPRTAQYTQVGNAVPPLLANQIAAIVLKLFQELG